MLISSNPQNTPEWLAERAGIPTSSSFDMIVTTKGLPSKQRQKYLYTLAAERLTGVKVASFQSGAMLAGIEQEDAARAMYELITGSSVKQVGVCFPDERKLYGSSPDGLINDDGTLEIKCPMAHTHIEYLLKGTLPLGYFVQIQGQLLVTGRKYAHFFSYYPGLGPLIIKVEPDFGFLMSLEAELNKFCAELDTITAQLKEQANATCKG